MNHRYTDKESIMAMDRTHSAKWSRFSGEADIELESPGAEEEDLGATRKRIVEAKIEEAGTRWIEVKVLVANRTRWRCFTEALCSWQEWQEIRQATEKVNFDYLNWVIEVFFLHFLQSSFSCHLWSQPGLCIVNSESNILYLAIFKVSSGSHSKLLSSKCPIKYPLFLFLSNF